MLRTIVPGAFARPGSPPLALVVALALAACGDSDKPPTGQVVARLDGTDITILEVNAELEDAQIPPGMSRRDAERAALQNIVMRRMLMKLAKERKLDQSPQFKLQERRLSEQLLVQALARDIAAKVPVPSREDTDKFIAQNPAMFAQRTIYEVEQIQFPRPDNLDKLPLAETKTLEQVETILKNNNIQFRRQPAQIDLLATSPQFAAEFSRLVKEKPQELFMFPAPVPGGQIMLVNRIVATEVRPFVGEQARAMAQQMLRQIRIQEALVAEAKRQQELARTAVVYQEGYEPPKEGVPGLPGGLTGAKTAAPAPPTATAKAPAP
ncbi:MAG: SurA N-terminal domain-containing protein [Sphingomonadaceae bacterium]|uniref:peptidylprolyl isomerase n=1 Tax=Thermaurantiacus sp. TaxID=2820283 RepID=UPI00298F3AB3|nr:peptidylprolyl isomerase [Thermaurantiacus sp.]MCS6986099.1 SurA N-terminal domain-containing protein [Sphingomonadaceae bacterium]MDW8414685.1 peptidylprolyl isomerase [Thermaurantiacus sp.]